MGQTAWFYSSLSQVTAAIVGFIGGFLILRLLNVMSEWRELQARLDRSQRAWQRARIKREATPIGEIIGPLPEAYQREDEAWDELYRAIKERNRTAFPKEFMLGGALLLGLLTVGTVAPLMALGFPNNRLQMVFLAPWSLLVLTFGVLIALRARGTLSQLESFPLLKSTEAELDDQELQEDAWRDREKEQQEAADE